MHLLVCVCCVWQLSLFILCVSCSGRAVTPKPSPPPVGLSPERFPPAGSSRRLCFSVSVIMSHSGD